MLRKLCGWILYRLMGWHKDITVEHPSKCIICLAPHTSNWDFIIANLYAAAEGLRSNYLMKKEWFFWPLGEVFRKMGGIPVDRDKKCSMTDSLAETARQSDAFRLTITPEGTRSYNVEWKKGFYVIAQKAGIPILLYALDYKEKTISCTRSMMPADDIDNGIKAIKEYYADVHAKHPENFAV